MFNEIPRAVRRAATGAAWVALAALGPPPATAQPAIRLAPGQDHALILSENPSTGYSWAIDAAASKGLDVVAVEHRGHKPGKTMPGAPGERLWTLRALKSGHAEIAFVYRRPWESAPPVDTRTVVVDVAP